MLIYVEDVVCLSIGRRIVETSSRREICFERRGCHGSKGNAGREDGHFGILQWIYCAKIKTLVKLHRFLD